LTSPPIFVSTINNFDDIAFFERQFSCFGWLECKARTRVTMFTFSAFAEPEVAAAGVAVVVVLAAAGLLLAQQK
jgi:hypothetical protein